MIGNSNGSTVHWDDEVISAFSDYLAKGDVGIIVDYTRKGGMNGGFEFNIRCKVGTDLDQLMEDFCNWYAVNRIGGGG